MSQATAIYNIKKAKKSVKKCICVLLNIWRSFEMAQLVKCRQNLLGLNIGVRAIFGQGGR